MKFAMLVVTIMAMSEIVELGQGTLPQRLIGWVKAGMPVVKTIIELSWDLYDHGLNTSNCALT